MARKTTILPDDAPTHVRLDLKQAPKVAESLGNMCVAWSAIEFRLFAFFNLITGMPGALARATYFSHFNFRARMQLLRTAGTMIMQSAAGPISELKELEEILLDVEESSKKRNKFIHDPWGAWDDHSEHIFQMRLGGAALMAKGSMVTATHLDQLTVRLQSLHEQLFDLYERLPPLLPPLQRRLNKSRSLPLEFSGRSLPRNSMNK